MSSEQPRKHRRAARARDQHAFAGRKAPDLADSIEDGTQRARDDGSILQCHPFGNERDVVVLDCDILRIAPDEAPVTGKFAVGTERLPPGSAVTAAAANMIALDGGDAII